MPHPAARDFVEITDLDPSFVLDVRYAGADNVLGRPLYPEARVFLRRRTALALCEVQRSLRHRGLGLLVYDGYRPLSVTRELWEGLEERVRRFVADPARGSRHNRGGAVDVSLWSFETGAPLVMPTEFDTFDETAAADHPGGDPASRRHRDLLRESMEARGFVVNPDEWWHFDLLGSEHWPVLDLPFSSLGPEPGS